MRFRLSIVFLAFAAGLIIPAQTQQESAISVSETSLLERKIGEEVRVVGTLSHIEYMSDTETVRLSFAEMSSLKILVKKELLNSSWKLDMRLGTPVTVTGPLLREKSDLVIRLYSVGQLSSNLPDLRSGSSLMSEQTRMTRERYEQGFSQSKNTTPSKTSSIPLASVEGYESTTIQALLVGDFGSNRFGAMVNSLTLSLIPGENQLTFSQPVGEQMRSSADSVKKAFLSKGVPWPQNQGLQLTFGDKQSMKDGPSAGLPMALLLEGLMGKKAIPKELAATGDVSPDRKVHAVGAVSDKIRAAHKAGCRLIMIPRENADVLLDMALDNDWDPIIGANIILIGSLDQALEIMEKWQQAGDGNPYTAFEPISTALKAKNATYLHYGHFQQELRQLATQHPEHGSSHALFLFSTKNLPARYSLAGSFGKLETAMAPFSGAMESLSKKGSEDTLSMHTGSIAQTLDQLGGLQTKLDPRLSEYSQTLYQFISTMHDFFRFESRSKRKSLLPELQNRSEKVKAARQKMLDDPSIRDSLM